MEYQQIILEALAKVVCEPGYLAIAQEIDFDEPRNRDIHEIALAHRLAHHLENSGCFADYMVDCEYNRHGADAKRDEHGNLFRPDIAIHVRGNNADNLIMIEAKKDNDSKEEIATVKEKLKQNSRYYRYQNAFLVIFPKYEVADCSVIPIRGG